MLKGKKKIVLLIAPLLLIGCLYIYDASLNVYTTKANETLVYKNHEFQKGYDTYKKFYENGDRKFELDKLIGKTDNSKFIGFKESVWKIKGKPEDEVIFVKGLMVEEVYERK
ncbi:hypothetical protein V7201_13425 [Bacillus sp. JJ1122]|uniref:hypothetical protein n=1 Tax=Bacillus sp. JJ1122 TaxID=3122951 RepID=UPI002FFE6900